MTAFESQCLYLYQRDQRENQGKMGHLMKKHARKYGVDIDLLISLSEQKVA